MNGSDSLKGERRRDTTTALARLHALLLRAARFEVARRRPGAAAPARRRPRRHRERGRRRRADERARAASTTFAARAASRPGRTSSRCSRRRSSCASARGRAVSFRSSPSRGTTFASVGLEPDAAAEQGAVLRVLNKTLPTQRHDVVVVGARCAGAATAMLLAAAGHDVVLVDRGAFPSDTLSTHVIARSGVVQLNRWGLLLVVLEAGTPPIRGGRFPRWWHTGAALGQGPFGCRHARRSSPSRVGTCCWSTRPSLPGHT